MACMENDVEVDPSTTEYIKQLEEFKKKEESEKKAGKESKSLLLKIPSDLHRSVRVLAAYQNKGISEYILECIYMKVQQDLNTYNLNL